LLLFTLREIAVEGEEEDEAHGGLLPRRFRVGGR
jgi:hypothetical protein